MGNSEIKRARVRLDESDLIQLKDRTKLLHDQILSSYETKIHQTEVWPLRYFYEKNGTEFEFIFSEMGSLTLRLAQSDRYRRNPPPIFYISLGKYSVGEYVWEDLNGTEVDIELEALKNGINESIRIYESTIQ